MANYSAPLLQATVSTAFKSAGVLWNQGAAGVLRRVQVYEIEFGQTGGLSNSDCQVQWDVSRFTATTTLAGSLVQPNALDTNDVTSPSAQYLNAISAELTYTTTSLKSWGINQRGSYRWRALDDGDNIVTPYTTLAGVGVRCVSTSFGSSAIGAIAFIER